MITESDSINPKRSSLKIDEWKTPDLLLFHLLKSPSCSDLRPPLSVTKIVHFSNSVSQCFSPSVQLLSRVQLFATPWTAALQASLSFTISWSLLRFMSIESVMLSNHIIVCFPLLLPSIFPTSGSFPVSWHFASSGQSIGASASVLPVNIQQWLFSVYFL